MKEKGEHAGRKQVAMERIVKRQRKSQEEKAWKKSQGLEEEDKRKWFAVNEDAAKKMLKYLEDSEDLKVTI